MNADQQPPRFNLPKVFDAILKIGMGSLAGGMILLGYGLSTDFAFFGSEVAATASTVTQATPVNYGGCLVLMAIGATLILIGSYTHEFTTD